jgi:metal iron transporter
VWSTVYIHAKRHTGVGVVCAVAYFDPYVPPFLIDGSHLSYLTGLLRGNWGVDLQAGSQFGYRLLFVVLLSGLFAVFLQVRFSL